MSLPSRMAAQAGLKLAPKVTELAPGLTTTFVREALRRAIAGVGPLPPAAKAAEEQLREQKGNRESAVHEVIENHVVYAGTQGFITNIGGIVTAVIALPANVSGLAVIQCRMLAGIAHLRGYDLDDPRVRNAILVLHAGRGRRERHDQEEEAARTADGARHGPGQRPRPRTDPVRRGGLAS